MVSTQKENRYWKARRSLRLWPIKGDLNQDKMKKHVLKFIATDLKLGESVSLGDITSVKRVPKSRTAKVVDEAVVEFGDIEARDLVRSSAYNLAGNTKAGIRLEIPPHLMGSFQLLSNASYRLKQKFPDCKRNIKFCDETGCLVLNFKTAEGSSWKRLNQDQAKNMSGISRVANVTADAMSELLEDGQDGQDGLFE